jgi:hypothetical protein
MDQHLAIFHLISILQSDMAHIWALYMKNDQATDPKVMNFMISSSGLSWGLTVGLRWNTVSGIYL